MNSVEPGDRAARVGRLDGLRGLCAFGVLAYHVAFAAGITSTLPIQGYSFWGVLMEGLSVALPPFFVLSGFFLFRSFARGILTDGPRPPAGPFLWRRALRILPAYWVMAAVTLAVFDTEILHGAWSFVRPFLLLHFYVPPGGAGIIAMEHTWTVPAEATYYVSLLVLSFVFAWMARRVQEPAHRMRWMLVSLGVLLVGYFGWWTYAGWPTHLQDLFYRAFLPSSYAGYFIVGLMLAVMAAYGDVTNRPVALFRAAARRPHLFWFGALVCYGLNLPRPIGTPGTPTYSGVVQGHLLQVFVIAFSVLLIAPLVAPGTRSRLIDTVLDNAPARYLGRISYGIYLWHVPVIFLWYRNSPLFGEQPLPMPALQGKMGFWALLPVVLITTLVIASASYYLLERPITRLRDVASRPTYAGSHRPASSSLARVGESSQPQRD